MLDKYKAVIIPQLALGIGALGGLFLISRINYLLFHCLVEGFTIAASVAVFLVTWNVRRIMDNKYLLFVGIAYFFVAVLDLLHTLAYKGMGVFPGYGPNTPTQLWILARYLESGSLFLAPFFFTRNLEVKPIFLVYAILVSAMIASVFAWPIFPDCFIQGQGLTPFKKVSEYIISVILILSIITLYKHRQFFNDDLLHLVLASILFTIAAELSFTFYVNVYGLSNFYGHFFKAISFYLIYKALVESALKKPYALLFQNLTKREKELADANRALKAINRSREVIINSDNEEDLLNKTCQVIVGEGEYPFAWIGFLEDNPEKTIRPVAKAGYENGYLNITHGSCADIDRGSGPTDAAVRTSRPVVCKEIQSDPDYSRRRNQNQSGGDASSIALPLSIDGRVHGALNIYAGQPDAFSEEEVKMLENLADDLAYGINALGHDRKRKLAEEALKRSERKYRTIFDLSREAIIITTLEGVILEVNKAALNLFGYQSKDELTNQNSIDIWLIPRERDDFIKNITEHGFVDSHESQLRHRNGHVLTTLGSGSLIAMDENKSYIINVLHDITSRKKTEKQIAISLEEKKVLLREIHHRVKNNLQVISSLLKLQENSLNDQSAKNILVDSQNRILAIALVHETLYRSETMAAINLKEYIHELVNVLLQIYSPSPAAIDLRLDLEDISIGLDQAIPLGLTINELICNSIKHAFIGRMEGRLELAAKRNKDQITIVVADNGIGLPAEFDWANTHSFGLQIIKTLIEKQLEGEIALNREQGAKFTIKLEI